MNVKNAKSLAVKHSSMEKRNANKNSLGRRIIKYRSILYFLIPGFVLLFVFNYMPMYGVTIAFKDYKMLDGIMASPWVGLKHFQKIFAGSDFYRVLWNTIKISFLKLICGFPAPIIFALLLNEVKKSRFKKVVQTCSYLPHFFSWVILSGILIILFSTTGPINLLLSKFGMDKVNFMGNKDAFIGFIVISSVWQSLGWDSIVYLAAISGIDETLYEAASIDGAGRFRKMISIAIPSILPTIITVFIINMGGVLNAGFDQIFNMYNPMVYDTADIIDTYVYRRMQAYDYSMGTAIGLFKSVVGLLMVCTSNFVISKWTKGEQGIW